MEITNAYFNGQPIFGLRGPIGPDGNPIGTIISYMGMTAPKDYLVCDGAEYNIADYSELARFFEAQFGTANHFGGDGTTTFAVPDLRNLFLRGYHGEATEQLSGNIGEKQEGTRHPYIFNNQYGPHGVFQVAEYNFPFEYDKSIPHVNGEYYGLGNITKSDAGTYPLSYISRPVNAAVLYCIKTVTSVPAENVYSTEEQVVGRWIDGKPLYRRTLSLMSPSSKGWSTVYRGASSSWKIDTLSNLYGSIKFPSGSSFYPLNSNDHTGGEPWEINCVIVDGDILVYVSADAHLNDPMIISLEYTKTTD